MIPKKEGNLAPESAAVIRYIYTRKLYFGKSESAVILAPFTFFERLA